MWCHNFYPYETHLQDCSNPSCQFPGYRTKSNPYPAPHRHSCITCCICQSCHNVTYQTRIKNACRCPNFPGACTDEYIYDVKYAKRRLFLRIWCLPDISNKKYSITFKICFLFQPGTGLSLEGHALRSRILNCLDFHYCHIWCIGDGGEYDDNLCVIQMP